VKDLPLGSSLVTGSDRLRVEPGYWSIADLATFLGCSRWTIQRRVASDPAFPVLKGFGGPRFPIERVKAYLQRAEQGRGRAYKTRGLLRSDAQPSAMPSLSE